MTRDEIDRSSPPIPRSGTGSSTRAPSCGGDARRTSRRDLADADPGHPVLDTLHPGLRARLAARAGPGRASTPCPTRSRTPTSCEGVRAADGAADDVAADDAELAGYLRNRARDLLSNDYESGDAAWVTGRFGRLNAQIGAYETYDDELFGAKAFFAVSLLLRDEAATAELRKALGGLQAIEDALPYDARTRESARTFPSPCTR